MFVERIETVLPCFADPWKIRMIVRFGRREVNFFVSGKVSIKMINDIEEGKKLVNSILANGSTKTAT